MARAWCLLKPGGKALLGFPFGQYDSVTFNTHRLYGKILTTQLFANFKVIGTTIEPHKVKAYADSSTAHYYQPMFLLEKVDAI